MRSSTREQNYFPRPVPASRLSWKDGLGRTPLLVWAFIAEPVVVPGCVFNLAASGLALPSLDTPGAGCCLWADAIAVAPNNAATTRVEIASLERMAISSFHDGDAGVRTCHSDLGSGLGLGFSGGRTAGCCRRLGVRPRLKRLATGGAPRPEQASGSVLGVCL